MMNHRLPATILLVLSIILLPYWVYVPALVAVMALYPFFWESVILGFLIDALYGARITSLSSLLYSASFLTVVGLLLLLPLRRRLRSHV